MMVTRDLKFGCDFWRVSKTGPVKMASSRSSLDRPFLGRDNTKICLTFILEGRERENRNKEEH